MQAREALRAVNTQGLDRRERVELAIGLGEALFLDDNFGPAAELLERALDSSADLGPGAHERLLDWWASTVDRLALTGPRDTREAVYARIVTRMEKELAADPGSAPASYWLAAAARGAGNLERAVERRPGRAGSPLRSARITAPHCAPTSTGWWSRASSPTAPAASSRAT